MIIKDMFVAMFIKMCTSGSGGKACRMHAVARMIYII